MAIDNSNINNTLPYGGEFTVIDVDNEKLSDPKTREKINTLLEAAETKICLSSNLSENFYKHEDVKKVFINAVKNKKNIQLLIEPSTKWSKENLETSWLVELAENNKKVFQVNRSFDDVPHWIIVDDNHIRIEDEHKNDATKVSNSIIYNTKTQRDDKTKLFMNVILKTFEKWWFESSSVL